MLWENWVERSFTALSGSCAPGIMQLKTHNYTPPNFSCSYPSTYTLSPGLQLEGGSRGSTLLSLQHWHNDSSKWLIAENKKKLPCFPTTSSAAWKVYVQAHETCSHAFSKPVSPGVPQSLFAWLPSVTDNWAKTCLGEGNMDTFVFPLINITRVLTFTVTGSTVFRKGP